MDVPTLYLSSNRTRPRFRTCSLAAFVLALAACANEVGDTQAEPAPTCTPCTQSYLDNLTPREFGELALANEDVPYFPIPSVPYVDYFGKDTSFCMGLESLTELAIRKRLIETGKELSPDTGLFHLMMCQSLFNQHDSAKLTAYRWLSYSDQRERMGVPAKEIETFRFIAASFLKMGLEVNSIDTSSAAAAFEYHIDDPDLFAEIYPSKNSHNRNLTVGVRDEQSFWNSPEDRKVP